MRSLVVIVCAFVCSCAYAETGHVGIDEPGACCYPDGSPCEILTYAECAGDPVLCPGDMDCDGDIDFNDIDLFVEALNYQPHGVGWPYECPWLNGDCNADGDVDFDDIDFFVARIGLFCDEEPGGGVWLGPDTTCDMCPCHQECPPGGVAESEDCGEDLNGGCDMLPGSESFEPISCTAPGNSVCGTIWAAEGTRDTDWYQLNIDDPCYEVTITVASEFPSEFGLIEQYAPGYPGCDNITGSINPYEVADDCEAASVTTICLSPGTYYLFVSSQSYHGLPCLIGNNYYINVSCTECDCCEVVCEGEPEGEPMCGDGYVDSYNGGCDSDTPVFTDIVCDQTYCGESGTFATDESNHRDNDWYKFVGDPPGAPNNGYEFTWTVKAEFEVVVSVAATVSGCDALVVLDSVTVAACTPVSLTTPPVPIAAGYEYYFVVAPQNFVGVPCGAEYEATLTCTPCEVCFVPEEEGTLYENEPCGCPEGTPGFNGGCGNSGEPTFTNIECGWPGEPVWIRGTAWADDRGRDTDWYRVTVTESSLVNWSIVAEFDVVFGIIYPWMMGEEDCDELIGLIDGWDTTGQACEGNAGVSVVVPPGTYWLWAAPYAFNGYPCTGFVGNNYNAKLTCTPTTYGVDVVDTGFFAPEGEPQCTDDYIDTYNGGCDVTPSVFQPISCEYDPPEEIDGYFGHMGTFAVGAGGRGHDTDWYELVLDEFAWISMSYEAGYDIRIDLYDAAEGCESEPLARYYGSMGEEQTDVWSPVVAPGTYWLKVYPATYEAIPCDDTSDLNEYWFWISGCPEPSPPCVDCTTYDENEVCGEDPDANRGCLGGPFEPFTVGTWYCGTLDYDGTSRDFDMWELTDEIAEESYLLIEYMSATTAKCGILPAGCDGPWWHLSATQPSCTLNTYDNSDDPQLPGADVYIVFTITGEEDNGAGWGFPRYPVPCENPSQNDYRFRATLMPAGASPALDTDKDQATFNTRPVSVPDRLLP